jgi:hypothetical protein
MKNKLILFILLIFSCGGLGGDSLDYESIKTAEYNLRSSFYSIKTEISYFTDIQVVLDELDRQSMEFLECLFGDQDLGLETVRVFRGDREISVSPLFNMRVFVVINQFECINADVVCGGEYSTGRDLMIISSDFSRYKHELAHRYGMEGDHSDKDEFKQCF